MSTNILYQITVIRVSVNKEVFKRVCGGRRLLAGRACTALVCLSKRYTNASRTAFTKLSDADEEILNAQRARSEQEGTHTPEELEKKMKKKNILNPTQK